MQQIKKNIYIFLVSINIRKLETKDTCFFKKFCTKNY